jgi:hypothetical protein
MQEFLIIAAAIVFAAASIIFGIYAAGKRRKELAGWALSKGLAFDSDKDSEFDSKYPRFDCLQKGDTRYAYNQMYGAIDGRVFQGCDYHYATGSGKSRTQHYFSLVIVKSPIWLKPLFIRPENFFDKIAEFAGFNDIDFESAEFSKKFYVKSTDKKWAYDIIHPQMMEFLLASPVFSIQFDTLSVIIYRDRTFSAGDFEAAVNFINGFFALIPEYVIQSQKLNQV